MHRILAFVAALAALAAPAFAAPAGYQTEIFQLPDGARVHDVAPAPDGKIWYTAQRQGALGILDPKSGAIRQIPLGEGSAPHGVIQGPDGAAWITDSGQNAIVRYDPKSGKIDVWTLPEQSGYANLNTGGLRRRRDPLVHRPERDLRTDRPENG